MVADLAAIVLHGYARDCVRATIVPSLQKQWLRIGNQFPATAASGTCALAASAVAPDLPVHYDFHILTQHDPALRGSSLEPARLPLQIVSAQIPDVRREVAHTP